MLIPNVSMSEFEKFGFKKCKGIYGAAGCYYLCVARGNKLLFVSNVCFELTEWAADDPRVHKKPNCKYNDKRDYWDIIYELIKLDMLTKKRRTK